MNKKKHPRNIERLVTVLCIAGAAASLAVIGLSEYFQLNRSYLGIAALAGFIVFPVSRKYLDELSTEEDGEKTWSWQRSHISFALLLAIFSAFLIASILHLHNLTAYERDWLYFTLFFSAVLAVLAQLFLLDLQSETRKRLLLLQIFLLGLSFKASSFFLYPSLSGNDPFYHQRLIEQYLSTGRFPRDEFYLLFPIFHFLTAALAKSSLVDIKAAYFYTSILQSLSLLLVYPVGRRVFGTRAGLIAALLLTLSDYQILWGVQIIPMTLGIVLYAICLMGIFLLQGETENRNGWIILIAFLGLVLVFTHNLSSLILLTSLFLVFVAHLLIHIFREKKTRFQTAGLSLFLIIAIATITYWGGISEKPEITFFQRVVASVVASLEEARLGNTEMVSLAYSMNLWETTLLDAGWVLLLFLMIPGILALLFKKEQAFSFTVVAMGLLFITYGTAVTGARHILSARWFAFAYFFCVLLAGFSLDRWMRKGKLENRNQRVFRVFFQLFITMILMVQIFTMATSPVRANTDSPLYLAYLSPRPGFYESELAGMEYFLEQNKGESATSSKTRRYVDQGAVIDPRDEKTYANIPSLLIRQYDYEKGFFIPYPQYQLTDNVMPTAEYLKYLEQFCKRSYDNGEVYIFDCVVDETEAQKP